MLPLLVLLFLCLSTAVPAYGDALLQEIQQVEKLVSQSVGAKEVTENGNNKAVVLRAQAMEQIEQAKALAAKGDEQGARDLLNRAKMTAFQAMRLVGGRVVKQKKNQDYDKRLESIEAMQKAYLRIAKEKNAGAEIGELERHVAQLLGQAQARKNAGQLADAIAELDKAYLSVRLAITRLREGDTLVRSLEFASREEEYQYELERNKTLEMLVTVLLQEKLKDPRLAMMINIPLKQAEKLRQQAIGQAASGDYEAAIETMEQATQQIIRGIRAAGIYIPG